MLESKRKELFCKRLSEVLRETNTSQKELANCVARSPAQINNWVKCKKLPGSNDLARICECLGLSADYLLGLDHPRSGTHKRNGITWFSQVSGYPGNDPRRTEIDDGIELFHLVVESGLTLSDIRRKVEKFAHLNESVFTRLVRTALLFGAIQLLDVEHDRQKEDVLTRAYGLRHCIVAKTDTLTSDPVIDKVIRVEVVAFLAARDCIKHLSGSRAIGLTGGEPISRFVDLLQPDHPDLRETTWWSLLASKGRGTVAPPGTSANSVVSRMVYKQPATSAFLMPFVDADRRTEAYRSQAPKEEEAELRYANDMKRSAAKVNAAILSVGTTQTDYDRIEADLGAPTIMEVLNRLSHEERERCTGDVLLRLLDGQGARIGNDGIQQFNDTAVYSIELDDLNLIAERGQVWVFAARKQKADIIKGLLMSGRVNCLVIENTVAKRLLQS